MGTYFYQATDRTGKFVEGDIDAPDFKLAVERVRKLNYYPIKISEDKPKAGMGSNVKLPFAEWFGRIKQSEIMGFTQQLSTLVTSGLTLDKSLSITVKLTESSRAREVYTDIQKRVHAGSTFADALQAYPDVFSRLYINMIRAGEVGGVLDTVLGRLGEFLESAQDMKNKIISSMIYPIILVLFGSGAVIFLIAYVVPQFHTIFADANALPVITQVLLLISSIISNYWWVIALLMIGIVAGFVYWVKTDKGRSQWDDFLLKLPVIGDLIRKIEVSRFSRTMSTLQKSGVPVLQSLLIVKSIISNRQISRAVEKLHEGLKGGRGLSKPLQETGVFPPLAVHMIVVGEETGAMDEMLVKVANTFDKEVDTALKRAVGLIGPIMIILMGGIIAFIVISVLWGMFSIQDMVI